jgi:hypothetical protein
MLRGEINPRYAALLLNRSTASAICSLAFARRSASALARVAKRLWTGRRHPSPLPWTAGWGASRLTRRHRRRHQ